MTATTADVLAELEARAGASDKDRDAWLAERAQGITATEVRDLYMRKITVAQLVDLKLGRRKDTFTGNKYTAWGNTREPIIAAEIEKAYGIAPETRVFHAADNPRFLASPDGVGLWRGELIVSEIKTGKHDMRLESDHFSRAGYWVQMVWSMRVTRARKALYVFERHDDYWQERGGTWPEPQPIDLFPYAMWVDYDALLAKELETIAIGFLVALDTARDGDAPAPVIDEELDTLAVNYVRGLDAEKEGKALKETSYREIIALVDAGEPVLQESPLARVSWSPEISEEVPTFSKDIEAAKAADPALYARLEQAQDDASQAAAALDVEARAVLAHEEKFLTQTGTERVVTKKAALRVTATKGTKK